MNRWLKFCQASPRATAWLSLLALAVSILLISCSSLKPEADEPDAETPQAQESRHSTPFDDTGEEAKVEPDGEASFPAPSEPAAEAGEMPNEGFAAVGAASKPTGPDLEAASPGADSPDSEADGESAQASVAAASAIIPDRQPEALEVNPLVGGLEADSAGAGEMPNEGFAAVGAAPRPTGPDLEAASPGADSSDSKADGESAQASVAAASAIIPDRQPEALEVNPLVGGLEADSAGAGEMADEAIGQADFKIDPLVAAVDPEQPSQASEADSAASASTPTRFLESPGELTITLESIGWIFRSDRSTPGAWRFLGREIIDDSTNFRFLFNEVGKWNFVFERQDLSGGESEQVIREVAVSDGSGSITTASPKTISDTLPANADARYAAALGASEAGKADEAIQYYEQDASRSGSVGARARGALVETAAKSGAVGPLLTWLPRYLEEDPKPEVLRAALEVFTSEVGYDAQSRAILEKLAESEDDYPEWPYRLAVLLEKPGEERDLDRAAQLYQEVISRWPLSEWRDYSEERLLWLQRHYFRMR